MIRDKFKRGLTCVTCLICLLFFISFTFKLQKEKQYQYRISMKRPSSKFSGKLRYKVVHLDLKGAPPKPEYLESVFSVISKAGGNALLIEYEDTFPFWGRLRNVSSGNAYDLKDLHRILASAQKFNFTVIPLVQTFGHLEFVLKLKEFKHLREVSKYPQSICPSKQESLDIIKEIINQVLSVHHKSPFIHIGCDEVYHLGQCSDCQNKLKTLKNGAYSSKGLFLNHVQTVSSYISSAYPGVRPLIWDDMLRSVSLLELRSSEISKYVDPVVWIYAKEVDYYLSQKMKLSYASIFRRTWIASAYKGASGERSILPDISKHLSNNLNWMNIIQKGTFRASGGLILTGWSRYDHFAVLCELLPASIPSLVSVLLSMDSERSVKTNRIFNCTTLGENNEDFESCSFPGVRVFNVVLNLKKLRRSIDDLHNILIQNGGWMSEYNIKHNYTNPWRIKEVLKNYSNLPNQIKAYASSARESLNTIFYPDTVNEWIEQNVDPLQYKTDYIFSMANSLSHKTVWSRRPLKIIPKS